MHFLSQKIEFPQVTQASPEGLLAVGGDLSPERLLHAYRQGIFPWYEDEEPILWWSPDPRFVLFPEDLKISKSMAKIIKREEFELTINKAFEEVIEQCSKVKREGQFGTWITDEMKKAYNQLHQLGYVTSVEVWQDKELVGGLYGVDLKNGVFSGESMFSKVSNASKFGLISFIKDSSFKLIDCQLYTKHLESLGAKSIPREVFMRYL